MKWDDPAAWIYENGYPNWAKAQAHRIKTIYVDPRSGNAKQVIKDGVGLGFAMGIYEVPQWYGTPTPAGFVTTVSSHIGTLIPQAYPLDTQVQGAPVMLDIEAQSMDWQRTMFARYRADRKSRETAYTNEPFKDGTVVPIPELLDAGFHWYPQTYFGDMSPVDPAAVVLELARWGVPVSHIHPFYDGAKLYTGSRDGCIFTLERIP